MIVLVTAFVVTVVLVIVQLVSGGQPPPGQGTTVVPISGSAAVLTDGVTIVYSDPGGLCRSQHLRATESPARVVLSLSETVMPAGLGCSGSGAATPSVSIGGPQLEVANASAYVRLSSPLGGRRLVDAVTGRTIPCFDQRGALLLPHVAGWSPWRSPAGMTTSAPYFGGHGAGVLAERLYSTNSVPGMSNGMLLLIVQVAGGGWHPPHGTVTTQVLVRGLPGLAAPGIIVWSEGGHTIAVIGEGAYPAGGPAGVQSRPPLPLASLQAIASALTGAGHA